MLALLVMVLAVAGARPRSKPAPRATVNASGGAAVRVDGLTAPFRAVIINGSSFIPLAGAAQALGARIEWDPVTDAVAVDGHLLRAMPVHLHGAVYLPVAPLAKVLNLQLGWDRRARMLTLDRAVAAGSPTPIPTSPMPTPRPTPTPSGHRQPFRPVEATDGVFQVTVTDLSELEVIKGYYHPKPGYKFVQVSLSQQNVSDSLQIYTGRFTVSDDRGRVYDVLENLSNFFLVILRPGGINFGYLMYEMPMDARPTRVILDTHARAPLNIGLQ